MVIEADKINNNKLEVKSKIWVELKGEVIFGGGRTAILEAIDECGSIRQAATKLGMSYRAAWGKLKATEERLGIQLLDRYTGGRQNGAFLTTEAKELLNNYRQFKAEVNKEVDKLFEKYFNELM
ncbi:MAG: LysR family transcriptional regulator [Clostridia bacterium]|jgi:molybdate transport system regulatory protein|nr:LysR family transcriptional regulator [Clostridia bacterium]